MATSPVEGRFLASPGDRPLISILAQAGLLPPEEIESAVAIAQKTQRPLWSVVLQEKKVPEQDLADAISKGARIPLVKVAAANIDSQAASAVPEEVALKFTCMPVKLEGVIAEDEPGRKRRPSVVLAMVNPTDLDAVRDIEFSVGLKIQTVVATLSEIEDAIGRFYSPDTWMQGFLQNLSTREELRIVGVGEELDEGITADQRRVAPAVKVVNLLIQQAIKMQASDIHIEPELNETRVRARQAGLLRELFRAPKWLHEPLVSRIKILAKLDIAERRRPQDGRLKVAFQGQFLDLRISTLPTQFGEKVVLRVLASGDRIPALDSMDMSTDDLRHLREAAGQPQGVILVTGPTGSGKTTTLYSMINEKKDPAVNIITVEDPVEYQLPGINQVQVNTKAGLSFASTLKAILRQDPDVILIGEIRDPETADIAFHAGMTGHLVFSTLHTNSTAAAITRLLDLGIEPYLIASSVNLIMAQRLARKICEDCKEPAEPAPHLLERLHLRLGDFTFYHGHGCELCENTGYSGRLGIFEMLRLTPRIKRLISHKATEAELNKAAVASGTRLLLDQAMDKVKRGLTTVEEVLRVIQLQEEEACLCPNCCRSISLDFTVCPYCSYTVRRMCAGCRQELAAEWQVCPYCSTLGVPSTPTVHRPQLVGTVGESETLPQLSPALTPEVVKLATTAMRPRILVVDDDVVSRRLAVKALQKLDLNPEITEAASGPEALEIVEKNPPDLLVLDIMMPDMSGIEVCRQVRSNLQTVFIPILMLTANTDQDTRTEGFLAGTDDYVGKPFSVAELHARIKRLLRRTYGL